jgi:hypothetical protein
MTVLTSQVVESWPHRFLSWIYPAREWAVEQPVDELEASVNRARRAAPAVRKPVVLQPGEAK